MPQPRHQLEVGEIWSNPEVLLFTSPAGHPIDPMVCRNEFKRLDASIGLDGWTPNELHHSAASLMSDAGMPIEQGDYHDRMETRRAIVEGQRDEINALVRQHHGRGVSLFGSVARGDDTESSDIDFLVEFEEGSSLFDLMDLQEALEQLLGVPVDVLSLGGLKDRDIHIRREAVPI